MSAGSEGFMHRFIPFLANVGVEIYCIKDSIHHLSLLVTHFLIHSPLVCSIICECLRVHISE